MADNPQEVEDLYPPDATPEVRFVHHSSLCSFGHSQLTMSGILRQVLLQHFVDPDQIISASLRRSLEHNGAWREGTNTGIYIESLARWRPELTESRPAIVLKEGDWEWKRLGIGDHMGTDSLTGQQDFGGCWAGTHTLFVLGNEGAETQILAWEVSKTLLWYARQIARDFDLRRFVPVSTGALAALKESTENYVVPVNVAYVVDETWWIQEDSPRLKRIVFRASDLEAAGGL